MASSISGLEKAQVHVATGLTAAVGTFIGLGGLVLGETWVHAHPETFGIIGGVNSLLFFASFGALATLLFGAPAAPLGRITNTVIGHLIGVAVSFAVHSGGSLVNLPMDFKKVLTPSIAIGLMVHFQQVHPPAAAFIIVYSMLDDSHWTSPLLVLFPVCVGALWMLGVQLTLAMVVRHISARPTESRGWAWAKDVQASGVVPTLGRLLDERLPPDRDANPVALLLPLATAASRPSSCSSSTATSREATVRGGGAWKDIASLAASSDSPESSMHFPLTQKLPQRTSPHNLRGDGSEPASLGDEGEADIWVTAHGGSTFAFEWRSPATLVLGQHPEDLIEHQQGKRDEAGLPCHPLSRSSNGFTSRAGSNNSSRNGSVHGGMAFCDGLLRVAPQRGKLPRSASTGSLEVELV